MIDDEILRDFGSRIKALRSDKSVSQEKLGLSCSLDRTYISGVERGLRNISLLNIHRLAVALSVSPSSLLEGSSVKIIPEDKSAAAFIFYREHIYRPELFDQLRKHSLKIAGCVPSVTWELFGSILTDCMGTSGYGADLEGIEVKSAKKGGSFEYQYHLNTGLEKLMEDREVDHLFCVYSTDYREVTVYRVSGSSLSDNFNKWIPLYKENYKESKTGARKQRFRKSITASLVEREGDIVMSIKDAELQ